MAQAAQSSLLPALSEAQVVALVNLLSDEDPAVYHVIREQFIRHGPTAAGWLKPHLVSNDPVLRKRARDIVDLLGRQEADTTFLAFCLSHGDDLDLEEGMWLMAKTRYPGMSQAGYSALLDDQAAHVRDLVDFSAPPAEVLGGMNRFLFGQMGFAGDQADYYNPDNSYLNRVLDRRRGNPISLSAVYLLIARRLRLPVAGIGMPGHFLCRFQSPTEEIYIDAFHEGRLLRRADCVKYLQRHGTGFHESFLAPATPRRILQRVCANLLQIHLQTNAEAETARLQRYIVALTK